jgi:DNA primase
VLGATIVLDGPGSVVWIPFDDGPDYASLRGWLHTVIDAAVAGNPMLFERARNEPPDRVRLSVRTNAPGLGTSLPYSLRCLPDLPVVTPIRRAELGVVEPETVTMDGAVQRLREFGDVFADEVKRIGAQQFAGVGGGSSTRLGMIMLGTTLPMTRDGLGPLYEFVPRAEVIQLLIRF